MKRFVEGTFARGQSEDAGYLIVSLTHPRGCYGPVVRPPRLP